MENVVTAISEGIRLLEKAKGQANGVKLAGSAESMSRRNVEDTLHQVKHQIDMAQLHLRD